MRFPNAAAPRRPSRASAQAMRAALLLALAASAAALLQAPRAAARPRRRPARAFAKPASLPRGGGALEAAPPSLMEGRVTLAVTIALEIFATTSMKMAATNKIWHVRGPGSPASPFRRASGAHRRSARCSATSPASRSSRTCSR